MEAPGELAEPDAARARQWQGTEASTGPTFDGKCAGAAQVLFQDGRFQWKRLENLLSLAQQGAGGGAGLDLSDTVASGARVVLADSRLRTQLLMALTEDNRLHIDVRLQQK